MTSPRKRTIIRMAQLPHRESQQDAIAHVHADITGAMKDVLNQLTAEMEKPKYNGWEALPVALEYTTNTVLGRQTLEKG